MYMGYGNVLVFDKDRKRDTGWKCAALVEAFYNTCKFMIPVIFYDFAI